MPIRVKIIVTYLTVTLLPLLFLGAISFHVCKDSIQELRMAQLRDIAAYKAEKIESYFAAWKADIEVARSFHNIRKNLPILNANAGAPAGPEFRAATAELDEQLRPMRRVKGLADIMLASPDGTVVYASDAMHSQADLLKRLAGVEGEAVAAGKSGIFFSDLFFDAAGGGRPSLLITAPALDARQGLLGVIVFELDTTLLYQLISDVTGLGVKGETLLGKRTGDRVLYLNPLRHDPEAILKRHVTIGGPDGLPIQNAARGMNGSGIGRDYRGEKVLAAWRFLPFMGWGMVAKIDAAEAFAEVTRLGNLLSLIVLLIVAIGGITAYSVARSIADPIKRLTHGAAVIGAGNLDHRVAIPRRDEIGQLSRAFDAMTANLKTITASRDALDGEIRERERAEREKDRVLADLRESESRVRMKIDSILSPSGDLGSLELADVLDAEAFQRLMDDFYALTRIPMGLIDLDGKVLVGVGWQDICTRFHRVHPESCANCIESDTRLSAGVADGDYKLYKCKNGLWDVATPIFVGDRHKGNLFIGQFGLADDPPDTGFFRAQAARFGFDEPAYLAALGRIPRVDRASLETTMAFFRQLAQMLSKLSFSNLILARTLTEREALMNRLKESERRLNKAQEIAHLGSWELDLAADRLTWSDEIYRIFGLAPQEFAATYEAFLAAVHPDDRAAVDAAYSGSVREGRDYYEFEHRVVRRGTGEVRHVHERCAHIRDGTGAILRSVGMVQDITARKQAEDELRRSNENLEQFAYVASHDLQEPLRLMAGYAGLLERRYKGRIDKDADEFIAFIVDGAKRQERLINDLLEYSRVGRTDPGRTAAEVDCEALLGRILGGMRTLVEETGAVVTHDPLPVLPGDESRFVQLFQNLIGNGIKFHGADPPRVHLRAEQKDGGWMFTVKDNGIGIEPQYKDRIFVIFQRLHGRGDYPGTGIGLAICKKIVESLGGRIWLESEPGQGSAFHFTIPDSRGNGHERG